MSRSLRTTLALLGILLLAFAVRAFNLNGQSFFIDEFSEIDLAKKPVAEIIYASDSSPPLFPLVLKSWLSIWGTDAAARWFSVACGVASVVCLWAIGRRLVDNATGLAAAFVTALLPMHVFYSQFVRSYSLLFFLVALELWLLLRALASDRFRDWTAFAAVAALGAYTHYYFAIFLATSLAVVWLSKRHWWIGSRAFTAYAAIAVAMLPLLVLLRDDLGFQKNLREPRPLNAGTFGYTYFSLFNGYTLGPSPAELQTMSVSQAIWANLPWLVAVGAMLIVLGYEGWRRLRNERSTMLIVALAILPVAILGVLSLVGGLNYNVRFVTWIMIAAAVWLGAGIAAGCNRRRVQIALAGFVLLSAAAFYNRHFVARFQHEDLRGAAQFLQANATPGDTVYVVSDYLADLMRYYLGERWNVVELPKPGSVNEVVREQHDALDALATASQENPSGKRLWLIYSRPFHGDPHGLLLETMSSQEPLELATSLAGVDVYRGESPRVARK